MYCMLALFVLCSTKNVEKKREGTGPAHTSFNFPRRRSRNLHRPWPYLTRLQTASVPAVGEKMWKEIGKERGYASAACENCGFSYQTKRKRNPKEPSKWKSPKWGRHSFFPAVGEQNFYFPTAIKKKSRKWPEMLRNVWSH